MTPVIICINCINVGDNSHPWGSPVFICTNSERLSFSFTYCRLCVKNSRRQYVKLIDSLSELVEINTGAPQGCVLSPTLCAYQKINIQAFSLFRIMVFGGGRRVCLGEALAKHRLFLFATTLVKHFRFTPCDEDLAAKRLPLIDPRTYEMGLVLHPQRYKLKAERVI